MVGLGIVLFVSSITGGYGLAGLLTATYALSSAFVTPWTARLIDRWGQARILLVLVLVHVMGLLAFIAAVLWTFPLFVAFFCASVAGASQPAAGSLVRARWVFVLKNPNTMRVAFAWESILDEIVFVLGPPFATILALWVFAASPLLVAVVLVAAGGLWLITQRSTQPPIRPRTERGGSLVRNRVVIVVTIAMVFLGGVFGSLEIVTVAAAREYGAPAFAGVILAVYAGGSMLSGIVFGARIRSDALPARELTIAAVMLAVVTIPLPFVTGVWALTAFAFLAGLAVAPVLILANSLVSISVPSARLTEGLAWINTTGLGLGIALAAAVSGAVVDEFGSRVGFAVTASCAVLSGLVILSFLPRRATLLGSGTPAIDSSAADSDHAG
jgi:predicted MFS family arabinose efflux permease